jgi:nucleoside diphosphate kinase
MQEPEFWETHQFVLVCSDAPYRGLTAKLARGLRREGFVPVAARPVRADPEMIDDLYSDLIAGQWQTWRYRLVDALLGLGPAVPMICRYSGDADDPFRRLSQIKGNQHPEAASPGTLRRDLGAINAIIGLMHTSDTPEEAEREAAVFGLSRRDVGGDPAEAAAEVDYLCRLVDSPTPETRQFDDVLADLRVKVIAALWGGLPPALRARIRSEFPDCGQLGWAGAGEKLAKLLAEVAEADLQQVLRCEFTPDWRAATRMGGVVDCLRRINVSLDPFEHLVLETSLHFPPRRMTGKVLMAMDEAADEGGFGSA